MTAEEWNKLYPVGTAVRYWPLVGQSDPPPFDTKTRSPAWTLGHGAAVVSIDGKAGGYCLDHLEVLEAGEMYTVGAKIHLDSMQADLLRCLEWQRKNREAVDKFFEASQREGLARFGPKFVHAQERALAVGFGGEFAALIPSLPSMKAQISAMVLAVMDEMKPSPVEEESGELCTLRMLAGRLKVFGFTVPFLKREADAGRIPFLKIGRKILFNSQAVLEALSERVRAEGGKP